MLSVTGGPRLRTTSAWPRPPSFTIRVDAALGTQHYVGVSEVRIIFTAGLAAAELWSFGEDDLSEAALGLSEQQLLAVWRLAAIYDDPVVPLPVHGRIITGGHVAAFAVMKVIEGEIRPLARQRRRPKSSMPEHLQLAAASPGPSVGDVHRLFGDDVYRFFGDDVYRFFEDIV